MWAEVAELDSKLRTTLAARTAAMHAKAEVLAKRAEIARANHVTLNLDSSRLLAEVFALRDCSLSVA